MSQVVRIERHEWEDDLVALTFAAPDRAAVDGKEPRLVFALHGLGSRKERHLDLCLRLARAGFIGCAVDARLHGERRTVGTAALSGERTALPFAEAFAQTVQGTVEDLSRIADELGAEQFGVIGHSMGGLIAMIVAASDSRVRVVVNVGGSIDMSIPPELSAKLPAALLSAAHALDPMLRAADMWPVAVLLLHGVDDELVSVAGARSLKSSLEPYYADAPDRLLLTELVGVGHEFTVEQAETAIQFVDRYLV